MSALYGIQVINIVFWELRVSPTADALAASVHISLCLNVTNHTVLCSDLLRMFSSRKLRNLLRCQMVIFLLFTKENNLGEKSASVKLIKTKISNKKLQKCAAGVLIQFLIGFNSCDEMHCIASVHTLLARIEIHTSPSLLFTKRNRCNYCPIDQYGPELRATH